VVIDGYSIIGHWWLLLAILLSIGSYLIGGYYWLFYCRSLVVILLVAIVGYSIGAYQ
jgi:hypothetical protein